MTKYQALDEVYRAWAAQQLGRGRASRIYDSMSDAIEKGASEAELNAAMDRAIVDTEKQRERAYRRSRR